MDREELDVLSWNIPISVLRSKYPEIHKNAKQPYIDRLRDENIEELKCLALYHSLRRKKSVFFIRVKKGDLLKIKDFEGKRIKLDDIDNIFEIKEVLKRSSNEYVGEIKAHSEVHKKENLERPETLEHFSVEYRKPYSINLICHLDSSIIEVVSRGRTKALTTISLFSYLLKVDVEDFEIIILKQEDQETLKDKVHQKEVILNGLNFHGSNTIVIKGPDVMRTLKAFKNKGVDLEEEAGDTNFIRSEMSKQPISFHQSGKISFSRKIKDIHKYFKKVFTKNGK